MTTEVLIGIKQFGGNFDKREIKIFQKQKYYVGDIFHHQCLNGTRPKHQHQMKIEVLEVLDNFDIHKSTYNILQW